MNNKKTIELLIDLAKGMEFRDDAQLEAFLDQLNKAVQDVFGWGHNKYIPYIENIKFKPASFFASDYEYQKTWNRGKKQIIDLLNSMMSDPQCDDSLSVTETVEEIRLEKNNNGGLKVKKNKDEYDLTGARQPTSQEVEEMLQNELSKVAKRQEHIDEKERHVQTRDEIIADLESAERIESLLSSLTDTIDEFKQTVVNDVAIKPESSTEKVIEQKEPVLEVKKEEKMGVNEVVAKNPAPAPVEYNVTKKNRIESEVKKVAPVPLPKAEPIISSTNDQLAMTGERFFIIPGNNNVLNAELNSFLNGNNTQLIVSSDPQLNRRSVAEQFNEFKDIKYAIVVLSGDHVMRLHSHSEDQSHVVADQSIIFQLGYLVAQLGRDRVVALYEEKDQLKRPTGFFDVFYIPYNTSGMWKNELARRLSDIGLSVNRTVNR